MRIQCLQHVPFEGPGGIADWAEQRGHAIEVTPVFDRADLPDGSRFDWLVILGGPMGVHDEAKYPWLAREKGLIAESIAHGKTLVGVCLGAQLIAQALGARVQRNPQPEIGWFPIELTQAGRASPLTGFLPPSLGVFHWHGDTFEQPPGALHLARSAACEQQVFLYQERVLGLQCHLESTPESVADLVRNGADELHPASFVQPAERLLAATEADYARLQGALFGILDRLVSAQS